MNRMSGPANDNKVKSRVKVSILGQDYIVRGSCSTEHISTLAKYVDEMMQETRKRFPNLPINKLAVLASLNLAEELFSVRNDYEGLLETLEEEQKK